MEKKDYQNQNLPYLYNDYLEHVLYQNINIINK
jgi:hypothetical protein